MPGRVISEIAGDDDLAKFEGRGESIDLDELKELAESNPVKKLLNLVLLQAIKEKASDIHFEPFEDEFKMRYRIDGALYEMAPPPKTLALPIISRVKVLASLNIAERRVPQDGRIKIQIAGRPVDLRVSTLPTQFGESVVLRVLDQSAVQLDITQLGMPEDVFNGIQEIVRRPNGIFIVTGPTGSGKTTTLYSALLEIKDEETKIITTEDPVEYQLDGISQIQVHAKIGLTFAAGLRSILRHDPDVILVGEIRDAETARIAVRAAMQVSGINKIHAIIGGFHLMPMPLDYVKATVAELKALNPDFLIPMHCSGLPFYEEAKAQMPGKVPLASTGTTFTLG